MSALPWSGTDVTRESADVVLLGNDLVRFVDVLAIARANSPDHLAELRWDDCG